MMKKRCLYVIVSFWIALSASAQNAERIWAFDNYHRYYEEGQQIKDSKKEKAIKEYREYYSGHGYRAYSLPKNLLVSEILNKWEDNGIFTDLAETEKGIMESKNQEKIGLFLTEAFNRIWKIAEEFRADRMGVSLDKEVFKKCQKAILYYGNLEVSRSNRVHRFHASCFAIPTAAVNTYFCFFKQMEAVEKGKSKDAELIAACDMLKVLGLQAWTQPLRDDETDKNVVSINRFRNHVWWVGGNALAYRSLLPVAVMYKSIPMIDVLGEVAQRGIDYTSQNTYKDAFWTEGCTADGAGWGHGMQCLVWGYPIDGNIYALDVLTALKNTPWERKLSKQNVETLFNFFRGSSWFYYKGYTLPYLDRATAQYNPVGKDIRTLLMVRKLLKDWLDSFDSKQREELRNFQKDAEKHQLKMNGYADGLYNGTRWFFNNDKLIKKNERYHILVNMASVRCDGLESAINFADEYNFYPTDGMTLFQRKGNEYTTVIGAWDVTATPGVTAREGMDKLVPTTNWRGYCSKHNFAGAATSGGVNAVAGYLFEKMNAAEKEGVNDKGSSAKNEVLYGVKAYKSYFMFGDYMLALGAGITNQHPQLEGNIRTTIDQTLHESQVVAMQNGKQIPVGKGKWSFFVGGKSVWVMQQGKFAYTVLPEYTKNASFMYETKKTEWAKRNRSNSNKKDLPTQVNILHLWVDHSQTPVDDTYGYVVYAGDGVPATELPFEVLRNDTLVQAAGTKDGNTLGTVFYQAGATLKVNDAELMVSAPCTVLIEKDGVGGRISVTDATMNPDLKEIIVTYNGKRIPIQMPQGAFCGKTVTVNL
ncbi:MULTISPECIES: polysaccharide lyase family 8 super-sandwich domain-containing protein [Bacteroides]|jgi:chondroitin AC lyase|uniref:polysaccharide lyase family 8 super-sandwich domain-containing protein n=1 Tax=Bacteroides TaxID=816 RepID=UPI001EE62781|nr:MULTISPECIES: polysaccharide lyase family 8 super-sandwich domain-containing protein [Bacteroides]